MTVLVTVSVFVSVSVDVFVPVPMPMPVSVSGSGFVCLSACLCAGVPCSRCPRYACRRPNVLNAVSLD